MIRINEESWEIILDFGEEEEYMEIHDDLMEYVENLVGSCNIDSYEDDKYWISCQNEYHCDELYDLISDKIDRLVD